jgi:hypothetical protein
MKIEINDKYIAIIEKDLEHRRKLIRQCGGRVTERTVTDYINALLLEHTYRLSIIPLE